MFSSVSKEYDHELDDQHSPPTTTRDYALLGEEEAAVGRREDTPRELGPTRPVKLATMRDDLEKGHGRF